MTKYLISFPSQAMVLTDEEFPIVAAEAHAVIEEAKAAGAYVFGGGIEEKVAPVLDSADGSVTAEIYPVTEIKGGATILELPNREASEEWARKIAVACRCSQELRESGTTRQGLLGPRWKWPVVSGDAVSVAGSVFGLACGDGGGEGSGVRMRFNPAPGWPVPPPGWIPPTGWQPDPSWPPAPPGWQFWMPADNAGDRSVPGVVGPNQASGQAHPGPQPADPDLARVWVAEITRLAERRRTNQLSRVTLIAPPVKGGLLGRIVAIGVGAALGGSVNDAALDAADQEHHSTGAVRLPDTCLLCGLLPGTILDTADITLDTSTLGFFLGGELLSQQKITLTFHRCGECADPTLRATKPLTIESYRNVADAWLLSLLFLNDRVAESVRVLNRPNLITARRCLQCGFTDDDQAWHAREDVCPVCHTLYAGGRAWLCPQCGKNLPTALLAQPRRPSTRRQALWGGVDCPRCGADVPKP